MNATFRKQIRLVCSKKLIIENVLLTCKNYELLTKTAFWLVTVFHKCLKYNSQGGSENTMEIIRVGNIVNNDIRKKRPDIYLGSGDMGASFDRFGTTDSDPDLGFMHGEFYATNPQYNMDFYLLPFKTRLEGIEEERISDYEQSLDIYDGVLKTLLGTENYRFTSRVGFHTENRDLFAAEYEWEGENLPVLHFLPMHAFVTKQTFAPEQDEPTEVFVTDPHFAHEQGTTTATEIQAFYPEKDVLKVRFSSGVTEGILKLRISGDAQFTYDKEKIALRFPNGGGKAVLVMGLCKAERETELDAQMGEMPEQDVMLAVADSWHRRWGESRISFDGCDELLKFFYRSVFHMLCSHSGNNRFVAPPMGWAGNVWRNHFPQDFEFIVPALLRLGHVDIPKGKVEMYTRYIETLREYTKRIYHCDGIMWAWEFPIGDGKNFLPDGNAPYLFLYEIHNSVYPAKLAWETACMVPDMEWRRNYAWKIIRESARFFCSGAKFNGKTWDIDIQPAMGMDEMGGFGKKNYLCALYAAKFTLTIAVKAIKEWGIDCAEAEQWEKILADGLAFENLIHPELQIYMNFEGDWKNYKLHKMKHPIPLNPISFLPFGEIDQYEKNAYKLRYDLIEPLPQIWGWSLVDIMLAAAHLGDNEAFWEAYNLFLSTGSVDEDWTVAYESSWRFDAIPYVTNEGILCRAILDGMVCDCWGDIRYHGLKFQNAKYKNLHLSDGTVVSDWE